MNKTNAARAELENMKNLEVLAEELRRLAVADGMHGVKENTPTAELLYRFGYVEYHIDLEDDGVNEDLYPSIASTEVAKAVLSTLSGIGVPSSRTGAARSELRFVPALIITPRLWPPVDNLIFF